MQKFTIEEISESLIKFFTNKIIEDCILDPVDFSDSMYLTNQDIRDRAMSYLKDFLPYLIKE